MKFNGITKKGRKYLAKIQSLNKPINFSKIKIGDGLLDNYDNPSELIDLQNFKIEKGILELNQENETVILKTNIDNVNLKTGYYPREIGVFVNDDGQELMYYYMNDGNETSWIPPESDGPFRIDLKINLIATNTTSIVVPNSGKKLYITKEFLENNYTKKGSFPGTAKDLEDRIIGLAGKQNGKFPLKSAIKGNVYLLKQTQKFYVCTQNYSGTTISVPNANFTELSVYENMNRLENLFSYQKRLNWFPLDGDASAEIFKVSTLKIMKITIETTQNNTSLKVIFPEIFSETPFITVVDNETNGNSTAYTRVAVDWVQKDSVLLKGLDRGFTMLVIGKG